MSRLLEDLIQQSRVDATAYEQFLKDAEALVTRLARKNSGNHPVVLNAHLGAIVLFNNLATISATTFQCPADEDAKAKIALALDQAMRESNSRRNTGDTPHRTLAGRPAALPVAEIADWVATFVYLPKLRDRVVLETAIRDALAKLDPKFACAEDFDEGSGKYAGLLWHKAPIGPMPPTALLVRPEDRGSATACGCSNAAAGVGPTPLEDGADPVPPITTGPIPSGQPRRFFGRRKSGLRSSRPMANSAIRGL